ncbi:hypothetical protein Tcan_15671 [Toxocara canis]|uniref:Uncharacterized protein n=1 Tax=Toxocara canis TaxID=6265 RepID=A0A0B2UUE9_TOXCA|nr:hypothetical protein Tcan_15671 [Toxocara canis]
MVHSWNSYADDLLINLVEAEGTSEREHESTLSFKALYEQNMVPSPTPTQNNPASSSSDGNVISNVEPIEVTPDGHTIVRRANGYAQSAHGAFHDIRADNDSNTMIVNNMIGHVRRANAHTPRYGTFGNSLLQAPFASFPLPPDGGMKLGDRTMRRHHTSQSSFASKW